MQKFVKKPVAITAVHYDGVVSKLPDEFADAVIPSLTNNSLYIATLEGVMEVSEGDWIIRGVEGEFYPCKPSVFAKTYVPQGKYDDMINQFAQLMREKMESNEPTKGNTWRTDKVEWLLARLIEEVKELSEAVAYGVDTKYIDAEAADVANFAMMIVDNYRNNHD